MKRTLIIIAAACMATAVQAQKVTMTKGPVGPYTLVKGSEPLNFAIGTTRCFVTEKFEGAVMNFVQNSYDETGNGVSGKKLEIPVGDFKNSFSIKEVICFAGKEYALIENTDKNTGTNTLLAREVDKGGNVSSSETEVMSFAFKKLMNSGFHFAAVSPGHTKMAIMGLLPFEKEFPAKCKIAVYDKDLKKSSEVEVELPGEDTRNKTLHLAIADDGTVYILKRTTTKNGEIALTVYQLAEKGNSLKEYVIDIGAPMFPTSYTYMVNAGNELIVAGVYYKRATLSTGEKMMNGVFYYTNKNKSDHVFKVIELDKPVENLVMRNILISGPTIFLLTEQYKEVRDPQPTGTTVIVENYTYTHKSVFVIGLNGDGSKKFQLEMAKEGTSRNFDQYDFAAYFICKGKLTVIYNDDTKKHIPGGYGKIPVLVTVSPEGLMSAPVIFKDNLKLEYLIYPCYAVQVSDNQLSLLSGSGSQARMITLTID